MGIEVNHNTISKREIKLLAKVKYNFHENELLILILILKNNPNIIIHRKWNWFFILIPYSNNLNMPYQLKSANKRALKLEKITFQMCPSLIRLQIPLETWAVRILLLITFFISSSNFPSKQNFTKRELKTAFGFNIFFEKNLSLESPVWWKSGPVGMRFLMFIQVGGHATHGMNFFWSNEIFSLHPN